MQQQCCACALAVWRGVQHGVQHGLHAPYACTCCNMAGCWSRCACMSIRACRLHSMAEPHSQRLHACLICPAGSDTPRLCAQAAWAGCWDGCPSSRCRSCRSRSSPRAACAAPPSRSSTSTATYASHVVTAASCASSCAPDQAPRMPSVAALRSDPRGVVSVSRRLRPDLAFVRDCRHSAQLQELRALSRCSAAALQCGRSTEQDGW